MNAAMFIDLLLIIVFVACVWVAARRGIINAVSGLLGSLAGLIGALLLTPRLMFITVRAIRPFLSGMVRRAAEAAGLGQLLSSPVVEETKNGLLEILKALGVPESSWEPLAAGAQSAGDKISDVAGQALAEQLAPVVTFIVLFLLIQLAVRLICSVLNLNIPLLRSVNKLGGALLGAVTGLCMVVALCWGAVRFAPQEKVGFLNRPALEQSRIGGAVCRVFNLGGDSPSQQ